MSLLGSLFKTSPTPHTKEITHALDLATYAGSLASNPADIDPFLDDVRKITATLTPEAGLSDSDEMGLLKVYMKLEDYLITSDPIRTFTKEELRSRLSDELLAKLATLESKGGA